MNIMAIYMHKDLCKTKYTLMGTKLKWNRCVHYRIHANQNGHKELQYTQLEDCMIIGKQSWRLRSQKVPVQHSNDLKKKEIPF